MLQRTHGRLGYFLFESLAGEAGLVHGISSRHGGVSPAPFDTLNLSLSVGDELARVQINRQRFAAALGVSDEQAVSAPQVHGKDVWVVDDVTASPPEADILVTNRAGVFLSQRFADCVPILLWDPVGQAIASAHAGWRGTTLGVAETAVRALTTHYGSHPADVRAAIGPSIGPCCYEVGAEVIEASVAEPSCLRPVSEGKALLDLWEFNRRRLLVAGLLPEHIEVARLCTSCQADTFFSHRASGGQAGRFGSLFGLTA